MRRIASIDIGTNTILMTIADLTEKKSLVPVFEDQAIPRLGKDVEKTGRISDKSLARTIECLFSFKEKADDLETESIIACGTSVFRNAENGKEAVGLIAGATGIEVEILSGETEANYTFMGVLSGTIDPVYPACVLDIGGGSTELIAGDVNGITYSESREIGCVRITERFFPNLPPSLPELRKAVDFILNTASEIAGKCAPETFIGTAGTVTTLAAIDLRLSQFDEKRVNSHLLKKSTVDRLFNEFSHMSREQVKAIPQVISGREDIILAGTLILKSYMDILEQDSIITSSLGLRHGRLQAYLNSDIYQ